MVRARAIKNPNKAPKQPEYNFLEIFSEIWLHDNILDIRVNVVVPVKGRALLFRNAYKV